MAIDVTRLELIGEGRHGKVYRIDEKRCVKIYKKKAYLQMEYEVLQHSQRFPFFPRIHECKENYLVREYFKGPNLRQFIQEHGLSKDIAVKLLEIIDSFIALGYSRIDCRLPHIIVTEGDYLKIIDPTRNMHKKCPYPRRMLGELEHLGYKEQFLEYTKVLRPDYYARWKHLSEARR